MINKNGKLVNLGGASKLLSAVKIVKYIKQEIEGEKLKNNGILDMMDIIIKKNPSIDKLNGINM